MFQVEHPMDDKREMVEKRVEDIKRKMRGMKKKILIKFGNKVCYDISVSQIDTLGLPALLIGRTPLCYFLSHLLGTETIENFFFYDEIEQLEVMSFETEEEQKNTLEEIFETFIKAGSEFEINIASKTKTKIKKGIEENDKNCYQSAKEHIINLLNPAFTQFIGGSLFPLMKKRLGERNYYTMKQISEAVSFLIEKLDEMFYTAEKASETTRPTLMRRIYILRKSIHILVERKFSVDFVDSIPMEELEATATTNVGFF
ncbi:MAG: uncharacterized protein A8A55_1953 [Amphiamblys sp. WSBS2006]|nr:MAG: uncharacterized protein A8A55_1953 [Amphiamblys sp. WSBS2006]